MLNIRIGLYLTPLLAFGVAGFHFLQTSFEHSTGVGAGQDARIGMRLQLSIFTAVMVLVAAMIWPQEDREEKKWMRILRRSVATVLITLASLTCLALLVSFQY